MFDKDIITAHNSYKLFLHNTFSGQKIFQTNEEIHPSEWLNIAKSATDSGSECLNSNNIFESFDQLLKALKVVDKIRKCIRDFVPRWYPD